MAAEVNARHNKNPTIAFTLPISCQVCLGKVKNPVLCPNQHVFCGPCMEVWLQKNKQCPACRTAMTSAKKIIGGLSEQEEDTERLTNPDLRRARFDLLYKEYENEFERMHSEIQLLKTENQILKQQTNKDGLTPSRAGGDGSKTTDNSHLLALTKKLQDATKMYEKVKGELTRLKQENTNLKEENLSLNRENQHLRQEIAGRSPHRYGRITVSTLETKLASAEKDVTRLTKALERSDKYIEELETELDDYRGKSGSSKRPSSVSDRTDKYLTNGDIGERKFSSDSKVPPVKEYGIGAENPSRRQLFSDDTSVKSGTGERSKYYYERNGDYNENNRNDGILHDAKINGDNSKKKVTFDLNKNTLSNNTTSFDLELPSPLKNSANASGLANGRVSPVKGVLKKSNSASSKTSTERSSDKSVLSTDLSKDSLSDSYNQKPSDRFSKDDDLLFLKSRSRPAVEDDLYSKSKRKYSADDSVLSEPSDMDLKRSKERDFTSSRSRSGTYDHDRRSQDIGGLDLETRKSRDRKDELDRSDLDDTQYIESELDELNISLTPEFTDCMKILNRAEKNVNTRDTDPLTDGFSKYRSSDPDMDTAFRASTGSIGQRSGLAEDFLSSYKADPTDKFTSSLDSYSRGRHVRTGSLDNIFIDRQTDHLERPSSAVPSASSMYPPSSQSKYMGGLTTGRTTLTRTPSLDNLLLARQATGYQNKYKPVDDSLGLKSRGYLGGRFYGEEDNKNKLDVKTSVGTGVSGSTLVAGRHDILGTQGAGSSSGDRYSSTSNDTRSYTSDLGTGVSSAKDIDFSRKLPPSGRQTPTLPVTTSAGSDLDRPYSAGRVTPTIPTHSEYMALSKPGTDKFSYSTNTSSGRTTPSLTTNTDLTSLTKSGGQFSDYKSSGPASLPTDFSHKPPIGTRGVGLAPSGSYNQSLYTNQQPPFNSLLANSNTHPGEGFHSLPSFSSTNTGGGSYMSERFESLTSRPYSTQPEMGKYQASSTMKSSDLPSDKNSSDKLDFLAGSNYRSDDKFSLSSKNVSAYNDNNYRDGTDFSNFSNKVAVHGNLPYSAVSLASQSNQISASSTGLPSSSSSLGLSYPGPSSASYLPTTLTSLPSGSSSYSTAHSVPLTFTTSSYTSSLPANTYSSKTLDAIPESSHFSYVSNVSGDYSSKNDTFAALSEPKKRLFENSDDLDMSVSPIKTNRRF